MPFVCPTPKFAPKPRLRKLCPVLPGSGCRCELEDADEQLDEEIVLTDGPQMVKSENADDQVDGMDSEMFLRYGECFLDKGIKGAWCPCDKEAFLEDRWWWFDHPPLRADAADQDNELESENDDAAALQQRVGASSGSQVLQRVGAAAPLVTVMQQQRRRMLRAAAAEKVDAGDSEPKLWKSTWQLGDPKYLAAKENPNDDAKVYDANESRSTLARLLASGELEPETAEMAKMDTRTRFRNLTDRIKTANAADKIAELVHRAVQSLPPSPVSSDDIMEPLEKTSFSHAAIATFFGVDEIAGDAESASSGEWSADGWSGRFSGDDGQGSSADGSTACSQKTSSSHMEEQ